MAEKREYAIRLDTSFDYTHRRFAPQTRTSDQNFTLILSALMVRSPELPFLFHLFALFFIVAKSEKVARRLALAHQEI